MSNYITAYKHPVDGDIRPCRALDNFFGDHMYGFWFVKKQYKDEELLWNTPDSKMESVVYRANGFPTAPAPEQEKSADDGDRNVTNKKSDNSAKGEAALLIAEQYHIGFLQGLRHATSLIQIAIENIELEENINNRLKVEGGNND